jgi:hypothetical protein
MCVCVVVFAFGTRGDVEPLLHLAARLPDVWEDPVLTLVTHASHKVGIMMALSLVTLL